MFFFKNFSFYVFFSRILKEIKLDIPLRKHKQLTAFYIGRHGIL